MGGLSWNIRMGKLCPELKPVRYMEDSGENSLCNLQPWQQQVVGCITDTDPIALLTVM